ELRALLEAHGASVVIHPVIEILPPKDPAELDAALDAVAAKEFDWAVFSSENGVRFTLTRLAAKTSDPALFFERGGVKLAAVGSHTADVLSQYGLAVAVAPKRFDADGLVDALAERVGAQSLAGASFLSFRASRGRKTLSERLTGYGARVREVVAYESVDVAAADPDVLDEMRRGKIDFATVASSASAKSFARLFGTALEKTRTVAISSLTAGALETQGARVAAIAQEATMQGLVNAVLSLV
ncbi:MAG: uroporphyrinogen-III synthase, partial [Thermoguttaceae bacterium]